VYHECAGLQVETEIPVLETKVGLFDQKIRSFLDACINGTEAPVPTWQILYNQAIIDGIAKSAALGREVEIEIPEI
jgi:predicted dehydrogenase